MSTITLWTDNGAHYKNTSLLILLSNISALTGVQVSSFRNFEPQKGKTKLDWHYATLKFSLKHFRREGNDLMSGEQIEKGTNGRLRGTHVYGVSIDRSKEPESAKTMKGITEFSDFEYFYDEHKNLQHIIARNQTTMLKNKRYHAGPLKEAKMIETEWTRKRRKGARQVLPVAFPFVPLRLLEIHVRVTTCITL